MEKQIDIEGLKINYDETGPEKGHTVLLMHGWGCSNFTVRSIAEVVNTGLRVINIDLPGHGKSSEPREVWSTLDFAHFIVKLIKALDLKEAPSVIGHSFGGRTGIALATLLPLHKLVLIDSAGIKPHRSINYYYKVYTYKLLKRFILTFLGEKKGRQALERLLKKKGSADYQAASPMMRRIMSRCVNEDLREMMPNIKSPTLLIWGEEDTATPLSDAKLMEKLIPDSGLVSFAGCGHYSFLDNPFGFRRVISEFFKNEINNKN